MTIDENLERLRNDYRLSNNARINQQKIEEEALERLRKYCGEQEGGHPDRYIVEAPSESSSIVFNAKSPFRVCEVCGYSEQEWETGYKKLQNKKVRQVSRYEANRLKFPLQEL